MTVRRPLLLLAATLAPVPAGAQTANPVLVGAEWRIEEIAGRAVADPARTSITFAAERRAYGTAGCNRFTGGFTLDEPAFAPAFRYFDTFERMAPLGILDGLPKVAAWRGGLARRPSVRGAAAPDHAERLRAFIVAQGGVLARRARQG